MKGPFFLVGADSPGPSLAAACGSTSFERTYNPSRILERETFGRHSPFRQHLTAPHALVSV
jgi:hypothetical protein